MTACPPASPAAIERRIQRVERGLLADQRDPPWTPLALADRVAHCAVPDVSIAGVDSFQIEVSGAAGPAIGGDGGYIWQVRGGVRAYFTPSFAGYLGYRLVVSR